MNQPNTANRKATCAAGNCIAPGLCPTVIALLFGLGASHLTGIAWLSIPVTVIIYVILVSGIIKRLFSRK